MTDPLNGQSPVDTSGVIARIKAMSESEEDSKREERILGRVNLAENTPENGPSPEKAKNFIQRIRDNDITSDDIPDELRENWVRSVLGGSPFHYTVPVMGGRVSFVFFELDKEEAKFARRMNTILGGNLDAQIKLSVVMQLKEVEGEFHMKFTVSQDLMNDPNSDTYPLKAINKAYDALCESLPTGLSRLVIGSWNIYSTLIGILTEDAFPDSF